MSSANVNTNNEKYVHPQHTIKLLQKLKSLRNAGENGGENGLCDVVLIAGKNGQRVPGHRVVLAPCSPYFETLFTGKPAATEVTLGDDVHGEYLLPLVNFCYTGNIEILPDTVEELVRTASRLQLNAVVSACSKFMERHMDSSNCLDLAALAELLNLSDLKEVADKYVCEHFVRVSQQEEFLKLNFNRLKLLIGSDELRVHSEEAVFHSVMSWVRYEMDEEGKRSKHIPALLALVRLSQLSHTFLTEHVRNLCPPLFKEAIEEANNVPIRSRRSRPRKSMQASLVAVWLDIKQKHLKIAEYSLVADEWKLLSDNAISKRFYFSTAFFRNKLLIMGGKDNELNELHNVECVDLDKMEFSEFTPMSHSRVEHSSALLDGVLYAAGGCINKYMDDENAVKCVERYYSNGDRWMNVAPMSVKRRLFGLAALNGRLYAVGGQWDRNTFLNSTECYDPKTEKWTRLANMNQSRCRFGITSGNGFLYVVGRSIERYDPQADKWTVVCSVDSKIYGIDCVFLDNRLLIVGFIDDEGISVQEYNLVTGTWTKCATFPTDHDQIHCLSVVLKKPKVSCFNF